MLKKLFRLLPSHEEIQKNRWLKPFANTLLNPILWQINRRAVSKAVAIGLFCGLIPGPFQMPGAAIASVIFRANLPISMAVTLYSNPFTIIPLYFIAFSIGTLFMPQSEHSGFVAPPSRADLTLFQWIEALVDWLLTLGTPLIAGLVILATLLSITGYVGVRFVWRLKLVQSHGKRKQHVSKK